MPQPLYEHIGPTPPSRQRERIIELEAELRQVKKLEAQYADCLVKIKLSHPNLVPDILVRIEGGESD